MKYSIVVPVFNRPDEVDELLASLCSQTLTDFEVIIVEDGSKNLSVRVRQASTVRDLVRRFVKKR